ncbi:MAG: hypothetical protein H6745_31780 [Deltaproteobacteria bacterium]|nr:hypothetical protein [Deltaproteobacteria bacterium]
MTTSNYLGLSAALCAFACAAACDGGGATEDPTAALGCPAGTTAVQKNGGGSDVVERWCWDRVTGRANGPYVKSRGDTVVAEGRYDDGRADGAWRWRDPDFAPAGTDVVGAFVLGAADGDWTATYRAGGTAWEHHFTAGAACGLWRDWTAGDGDPVEAQYPPCDGSELPVELPFEPRWDGEGCDDVAGAELVVAGTERWCAVGGVRQGPYRDDYGDGLPRVEGQYDGGARVGTWTERYPGGQKAREGAYADGAQDGVWTAWWGHGLVRETVTWQGGSREGAYASFHPSGARFEAGDFAADREEGVWTTWHQSGGKAEEGSFHRGLRVNEWRAWDVRGRDESLVTWVAGTQNGAATFWSDHHVTGARVRTEGWVEDGVPVGRYVSTWVDGGAPAGEYGYIDGVREGAVTELWPNGEMLLSGTFLVGLLNGRWQAGYENGQLWVDGWMFDGVLDGPYVEYWDNGQKKAEGVYDRGYRGGAWQYWDEAGNPREPEPGEAM